MSFTVKVNQFNLFGAVTLLNFIFHVLLELILKPYLLIDLQRKLSGFFIV